MNLNNLKILIATDHLDAIGGTETYTYTIIEEFVKRGVPVEYFTLHSGIISDRIEKELGVKFATRKKYDIILANHNSIVHKLFGRGFIIQTCHGIFSKLEQPCWKADAFVAISKEVQLHVQKRGYPSRVIHNGVNLERFSSVHPINKPLQHILSLCQSASANKKIREICAELNIDFQYFDKNTNPVWHIEEEINKADLVIGIGRSIYDAMACGRSVISFDERSYSKPCGDGYLKGIFEKSIDYNCSGRSTYKISTETDLSEAIKQYEAEDGLKFRALAEKFLDIKKVVDQYIACYLDAAQNSKKTSGYFIKHHLYYPVHLLSATCKTGYEKLKKHVKLFIHWKS